MIAANLMARGGGGGGGGTEPLACRLKEREGEIGGVGGVEGRGEGAGS